MLKIIKILWPAIVIVVSLIFFFSTSRSSLNERYYDFLLKCEQEDGKVVKIRTDLICISKEAYIDIE